MGAGGSGAVGAGGSGAVGEEAAPKRQGIRPTDDAERHDPAPTGETSGNARDDPTHSHAGSSVVPRCGCLRRVCIGPQPDSGPAAPSAILGPMGATETVDLFMELINDDRRDAAVNLFAEHAVLGISVPGSDERTNLRGRDKVGGWFVRAGDGFRMYANDGRSMGASYIADLTIMRPGAPSMHVEANFRVEGAEIVSLFLQPL